MAFDLRVRARAICCSSWRVPATWLALSLVAGCAAEPDDGAQPGPDASSLDGSVSSPVTGDDAGGSADGSARDAAMIDITVPGQDAGARRDGGVIEIPIPTVKVECGAAPCEVKSGIVCCETWDKTSGFGKASCLSQAMCTSSHSTSGASNRAVTSLCDDAADCSGGQVCCYVRIASANFAGTQPLCDGLFSTCSDIGSIVGPGASRACLDVEECNSPNPPSFGTGVVSCVRDGDCAQVGGTCQPEKVDAQVKPVGTVASTTGARPYANVCR